MIVKWISKYKHFPVNRPRRRRRDLLASGWCYWVYIWYKNNLLYMNSIKNSLLPNSPETDSPIFMKFCVHMGVSLRIGQHLLFIPLDDYPYHKHFFSMDFCFLFSFYDSALITQHTILNFTRKRSTPILYMSKEHTPSQLVSI